MLVLALIDVHSGSGGAAGCWCYVVALFADFLVVFAFLLLMLILLLLLLRVFLSFFTFYSILSILQNCNFFCYSSYYVRSYYHSPSSCSSCPSYD